MLGLKHEKINFETDFESIFDFSHLLGLDDAIKIELRTESEIITQLDKFQANYSLMGTIKTKLIRDDMEADNYRSFFIFHRTFFPKKEQLPFLIHSYPEVFKSYFGIDEEFDKKKMKALKKRLGKNNPKVKILTYLAKLMPFPNDNTTQINSKEHEALNEFFELLIRSEGASMKCPADGKVIEKPHESHFGVVFCSEKCRSNYQRELFNRIKREIQFDYFHDWQPKKRREIITDNFGAHLPVFPDNCVLCTQQSDYSRLNTLELGYKIPDFTLEDCIKFLICKHCQEYPSLGRHGAKFSGNSKEKSFTGVKIRGKMVYLFELGGKSCHYMDYIDEGWAEFHVRSKLLAWNIIKSNLPRIDPESVISLLKSFSAIDKDCAIDWLERIHFLDWTVQLRQLADEGLQLRDFQH